MSMSIEWVNNHIEVNPHKKPKKITGTRFAAILGLNHWNTPFKTWCEITRTYEEPFVDTIYTKAGKVIEPKQAEYMKNAYFMENLITPTDVYGEDYFKKTFGDFFKDTPIFGGMWDYLLVDENGKPITVLEMKTTKRSEDWENGVPEYYAMQAALYAWLLGVDDVLMVASFLDTSDYEHPENFTPTASNTAVIPFKVSEKYPDFGWYYQQATDFWENHVITGISPDYDEKRDSAILEELRKNKIDTVGDLKKIVEEAENLKNEIDKANASLKEKIGRYKTLSELIKAQVIPNFREGDEKVVVKGDRYEWCISRGESVEIDKEALKNDNLYDKYALKKSTYRMNVKELEK